MTKMPEKMLDKAIEQAFLNNPDFTRWFLSKTKFSKEVAAHCWCRSNNPWGRTELSIINPETGLMEKIVREGETDVLVVFETDAKRRFALHIENKLASGKFTRFQPELYAARAASWVGNEKYGNYEDFETVLIAPIAFYERCGKEAKKFDRYVSHEDISAHIPTFSGS